MDDVILTFSCCNIDKKPSLKSAEKGGNSINRGIGIDLIANFNTLDYRFLHVL